jgi:hypothetical protein
MKVVHSYDAGKEAVINFEICGNKIYAVTSNKLNVFEIEKKKVQFEADCDDIFDLLYESNTHLVYLLVQRKDSTAIMIFDSQSNELKRAIVFQEKIIKLVPMVSNSYHFNILIYD